MIDHNTYDKDNEVNYINYDHAELNSELLEYYKGLIELRKSFESFRRARYEDVTFYIIDDNPFAIGYAVNYNSESFIVLMNANNNMDEEFILPEGEWDILVDPDRAGVIPTGSIKERIIVEASAGYVLKRK